MRHWLTGAVGHTVYFLVWYSSSMTIIRGLPMATTNHTLCTLRLADAVLTYSDLYSPTQQEALTLAIL